VIGVASVQSVASVQIVNLAMDVYLDLSVPSAQSVDLTMDVASDLSVVSV